jgi:hypothetical protein
VKNIQPLDKVYCFLVSNEARDYYGLSVFLRCCEIFLGYEVEFHFVWDVLIIRKNPPKLVVLPNCRGNNLYFEIAEYCETNGVPIFYGESEGNYFPKSPEHYWALNLARRPLCPVTVVWNEPVKKSLIEQSILAASKLFVSGAPGFDRYQYLAPPSKSDFLKRVGHPEKKIIIGYAGWAFGKIYNKEVDDICINIGFQREEGINWLKKQKEIVEGMLRFMIESNPDVLFILKKHPRENFESDLRDSPNEMNSNAFAPNVLYVKNEFDINDLIGVSDLWTAFESTSIMEAWLMGKQTLLLHGVKDFKRSRIIEGTMTADSKEQLAEAIQCLRDGNSSFFNPPEVVASRTELLAESIGYADGLNGVRLFSALRSFHTNPTGGPRPKFSLRFVRRALIKSILTPIYSRVIFTRIYKLKKVVWVFDNRTLSVVKERYSSEKGYIDDFLQKNGIHTIDFQIPGSFPLIEDAPREVN